MNDKRVIEPHWGKIRFEKLKCFSKRKRTLKRPIYTKKPLKKRRFEY